jgi:hypothetical protein
MTNVASSKSIVLVILVDVSAIGCSTIEGGGAGGGGSGGGGGTSDSNPWWETDGDGADGTDGNPPAGPEYSDECRPDPAGSQFFHGWQITCNASSSTRKFVNPTDSLYVELQDLSGSFGSICCGGSAHEEVADASCQVLCMEYVCEAARVQHVAWAVDVSNDGMGGDCLDTAWTDCGFDFESCMSGMLHEQVAQPGDLFTYILQAECEAVHDQDLSPWGTDGDDIWDWIELPNIPGNDAAPVCAPAPEPEPGPPERSPEMEIEEEPGTSVTLHWAVADGPSGTEQSLEPDVAIAYSVSPCADGDCISLSRLDLTIPDGIYRGLSLANLHLILEEATPAVPLSASGDFVLPPRSIHATSSFTVEGIPIAVTGYNAGSARGVALPHADTMTLTNLAFDFVDGAFGAALEINLNGTYIHHAPDAIIKLVDTPTDCVAPVAFEAASIDLDGDSLTHVWWVPPWFIGTGSMLEAPLPPGLHHVYLTSIDSSGRADSTAFSHVRSCR